MAVDYFRLMRLSLRPILFGLIALTLCSSFTFWGFFGHEQINRLAVFALPPEMFLFYKRNIEYITEASVNPDRRRFSSAEEAPRHYIDIDHYGISALSEMPRHWNEAVTLHGEDTLKAYGILPWHIQRMYFQLKDAFLVGDPQRILRLSAELGHYVGDAHVPLHTTENYNGQLTGQHGIHALWESRLPELFSGDYDFFTGRARYISDVQIAAWQVIKESHLAVDSVLSIERILTERFGERKYSFESKARQTLKVYSQEFSRAYHQQLNGMVERRMRAAISMTASLWYSAWVDAGQPDLKKLINYRPTAAELQTRMQEVAEWKKRTVASRDHEVID